MCSWVNPGRRFTLSQSYRVNTNMRLIETGTHLGKTRVKTSNVHGILRGPSSTIVGARNVLFLTRSELLGRVTTLYLLAVIFFRFTSVQLLGVVLFRCVNTRN